MSLTKADDYPIHQISKPVSEVGSERNFHLLLLIKENNTTRELQGF